MILDMNLDISATIKGFTQRWSGDLLEEGDENVCWRYMVKNYNASYFIDESFKYVQPSGEFVMGCQVLLEHVNFPENVVCVRNIETPCPFLSTHHPLYFKTSYYAKVEFD